MCVCVSAVWGWVHVYVCLLLIRRSSWAFHFWRGFYGYVNIIHHDSARWGERGPAAAKSHLDCCLDGNSQGWHSPRRSDDWFVSLGQDTRGRIRFKCIRRGKREKKIVFRSSRRLKWRRRKKAEEESFITDNSTSNKSHQESWNSDIVKTTHLLN